MYLYLATAAILRQEDDSETIATLLRKGWAQIADPEVPGSTWDGKQWNPPEPPAPVSRWVEFGVALGMSPAVNQFVGTLAQAAPVLHLMIGVGLGQAAQGDPKTFLGAWGQCSGAGLVPPELLAAVVELAGGYDLPKEFVGALTADP